MSLSRQVAPAALLSALAFAPSPARADSPTTPVGCQPSQGSLAFLGCSVAQKLGPAASGASVTVIDLKSDRELPAATALRERVQAAVASALGSDAADGKRAEQKPRLRVELSIEKSGGNLRLTAELRRATGLWQRVRHSKPRAEQRAFAEAPLDAELRALIPPPPLVVSETLKLKAPERAIVALACGPLGSDGGQELAIVSRSTVRVGRVANRAFVERKRAAWSTLSAIAAAPLREPIASAEITPQGTLRVGSTDRRDGLELSRDLAVLQRFEAQLPVPGGGCVARSELGVASQLGACAAEARADAATLDALAGSSRGLLGRELGGARLLGAAAPAGRVGAQLALGDADSDGALELAFSSDTLDAAKDRLTVITLQGNKPTPRFELAAPAISAITICSGREGPGMAPIVLATGDELWLLR
ncbi:MAG TPA: hypothetical protein VEQ58_23890 [Polyangiaceae bacterium]|nr:hypothetical protein [Polyangiaceae bacterium]